MIRNENSQRPETARVQRDFFFYERSEAVKNSTSCDRTGSVGVADHFEASACEVKNSLSLISVDSKS